MVVAVCNGRRMRFGDCNTEGMYADHDHTEMLLPRRKPWEAPSQMSEALNQPDSYELQNALACLDNPGWERGGARCG